MFSLCQIVTFIFGYCLLKKYPQFIPYFSDVIFKNKEFITKEDYNKILDKLYLWLKVDDTLEYILISIVKMFDAKNEDKKNKLFDYFKIIICTEVLIDVY